MRHFAMDVNNLVYYVHGSAVRGIRKHNFDGHYQTSRGMVVFSCFINGAVKGGLVEGIKKKRKTNKKVSPAQMQSEECCVPTFGATVSSDGWDSAFEAAVCFPLSVCFRCQWRKFTSSQGHSLDNGLSMPLSTTDFTSVRIRYSELSTRHTLLSDNQNEHFRIS